MTICSESNLFNLLSSYLGKTEAQDTVRAVEIDPELFSVSDEVCAAEIAMALNLCLFSGLLDAVPHAVSYVADRLEQNAKINFDHGALRTVSLGSDFVGSLPAGTESIARILRPLGYHKSGVYPLERLNMTGYSWAHEKLPQEIPQFFVSELHVDRFSKCFQEAAARVFGSSRDPLDDEAHSLLRKLEISNSLQIEEAKTLLAKIVPAFGRHHAECDVDDYQVLLNESAEAAWIATEGNVFNHATDRVADVEGLAKQLRANGFPIKDAVEHSQNGRVRQTALHAALVERTFKSNAGQIRRTVPGSFFEFISRKPVIPSGPLDLSFDSANAQGIFKMTSAS